MGDTFVYRKKYHIHNSLKELAGVRQSYGMFGLSRTNAKHRRLAPKQSCSDELVDYFHEEYPCADGSRGRIIRIKPYALQANAPALVYLPGGGLRYAPAPHHYRLARLYALACGCQVLVVNYRLCTQCPYPTSEMDAYDAWKWVVKQARYLGLDRERIAIGGDGVGGWLALSCMLRAQKEGVSMPCFQMLLSPILDRGMKGNSHQFDGDAPVWRNLDSKILWDTYRPKDGKPEFAFDFYKTDLRNFPPAYLELVINSSVYSEVAAYWGRLEEDNVSAELNEVCDAVHGFDAVAESPVTRQAVARRISALKKAWNP